MRRCWRESPLRLGDRDPVCGLCRRDRGLHGHRGLERLRLAVHDHDHGRAPSGFGEVHPLSPSGRLFTIGLIIAGVGALGFAFGQLVEFVLRGAHSGDIWRDGAWEGDLRAWPATPWSPASAVSVRWSHARLPMRARQFVVVDLADESEAVAREADWIFVRGDATEEEVLGAGGDTQGRRASSAASRLMPRTSSSP